MSNVDVLACVSLHITTCASKAAPIHSKHSCLDAATALDFPTARRFCCPLSWCCRRNSRRLRLRLGSGFRPDGRASPRDCPRPYTAIGSATSFARRVSFVCPALVFVLLWLHGTLPHRARLRFPTNEDFMSCSLGMCEAPRRY
jgi:hypothetical protein